MLKIKTKYERPRLAVRTDRITDAAEPKLTQNCVSLADRVLAVTLGELSNITSGDQDTADAVERYAESLHRVDNGVDWKRKKSLRGSIRPVALVTTSPGAYVSAPRIEFGRGFSPAFKPMAKAIYQLGGTVYK